MTDTDTDTDLLRLHRQIVQRPHDLDIRAVYADRLDDLGDHDRAELIRVQVAISSPAGLRFRCGRTASRSWCKDEECHWCVMHRREKQLLHAPAPGLWNPNPGNGWVWAGTELHNAGSHISWKYHNGFPDHITCDCWTWEHHGPKIVSSAPVVRVELSDREPYQLGDSRASWHSSLSGYEAPDYIPDQILQLMSDYKDFWLRTYSSVEAAKTALSAAALLWARSVAGLPPLEQQP